MNMGRCFMSQNQEYSLTQRLILLIFFIFKTKKKKKLFYVNTSKHTCAFFLYYNNYEEEKFYKTFIKIAKLIFLFVHLTKLHYFNIRLVKKKKHYLKFSPGITKFVDGY